MSKQKVVKQKVVMTVDRRGVLTRGEDGGFALKIKYKIVELEDLSDDLFDLFDERQLAQARAEFVPLNESRFVFTAVKLRLPLRFKYYHIFAKKRGRLKSSPQT